MSSKIEVGTRVRIIKPWYGARAVMPIVGTEGVVVENPNGEGGEPYIWVRVENTNPHGDPSIEETPFGLVDMNGTTWLCMEYDLDNEDRNHFCSGYERDQLELASEPSSVAGYEMELRDAWMVETKRGVDAYFEESDRIRDAISALVDALYETPPDERDDIMAKIEAWRDKRQAHSDASFNPNIKTWENCLAAVGLLGAEGSDDR